MDSFLVCSSCGHTFAEFQKVGLLGCPDCYRAFEHELGRVFKRLHGATHHADDVIMTFDDLASRSACWLNGLGDCSTLVVSSQVRLARNLAQWPFPHRATLAQRQKVIEAIVGSCDDVLQAFFETGSLSDLQRKLLVERHLISPARIVQANQCGVIVGDDGHLSAMVNEEDHLRLQGIFPGLQPREAWKAAHGLERIFADQLDFAFSDAWGYLTACPTNTGTGYGGY